MSTKSARRQDIEQELPACLEHFFDDVEAIAEREALRIVSFLCAWECTDCAAGDEPVRRGDSYWHGRGPIEARVCRSNGTRRAMGFVRAAAGVEAL